MALKASIAGAKHIDERQSFIAQYTEHVFLQWLDRQAYWSFRSLSVAYFEQSVVLGVRLWNVYAYTYSYTYTYVYQSIHISMFRVPCHSGIVHMIWPAILKDRQVDFFKAHIGQTLVNHEFIRG